MKHLLQDAAGDTTDRTNLHVQGWRWKDEKYLKGFCRIVVGISTFVPVIAVVISGRVVPGSAASVWTEIDTGLCYAEFAIKDSTAATGDKITVVKIDPRRYSLRLLCASERSEENMPLPQWVRKYGLIGGVNAGMYLTDYTTNVGYMKNRDHLNNPRINPKYSSIAAFDPVDAAGPPFRIFDTDVADVRNVILSYNTVVQNLRLVKRPGINRWKPQPGKWSEVALGEDRSGNALLIFSRFPFSMYELNRRLLALPIGLVAAQHLEGGHEASLYLDHNGIRLEMVGSYATGFIENDGNRAFRKIPNVIGFTRRTP